MAKKQQPENLNFFPGSGIRFLLTNYFCICFLAETRESDDGGSFQETLQSFLGSLEVGASVIVIDGLEKLGRSLECSQKRVRAHASFRIPGENLALKFPHQKHMKKAKNFYGNFLYTSDNCHNGLFSTALLYVRCVKCPGCRIICLRRAV